MIKAPNCDRGRSRSEKRINRLVTLLAVSATSRLDHIRLARHRSEQLAKVPRQLTPNIRINPLTLAT